jgi:glycosyltransferase involved in cell wall biosynthesis
MAVGVDYDGAVRTGPATYSWRWLAKNAWKPHWRSYASFSGTSEDPVAIVGVLSAIHRRPSFILADEIRTDSYYGNRPESWKRLCRWGYRRAALNIVNDDARLDLLRQYASLPPTVPLIVYPGCYHNPPTPPADYRRQLRRQWGIPEDAFVIGASGRFNLDLGADLLFEALASDPSIHAVIQPLGYDSYESYLVNYISRFANVYVESHRLDWDQSWLSAVGMDVGMAFYRQQASQFQKMGISSNRLCMFLAMGVPVIGNRQPSYEFLERFGCGVMVSDAQEFMQALEYVRRNLDSMRAACKVCFEEYIMPPSRYQNLARAIANARGSQRS